jgi:hypothetical protein
MFLLRFSRLAVSAGVPPTTLNPPARAYARSLPRGAMYESEMVRFSSQAKIHSRLAAGDSSLNEAA